MKPVEKNKQYTIECIDLTHDGLGVAKIDGFPIFIENVLPTETATIKVIKVGKSFAFGKLEALIEVSKDRVEMIDKKGTWIGTMPLQHMTYESQLAFKTKQVKQVMSKIAKMPDVPVRDTLGAPKITGYRNKAQIPVRLHDGQLETGFFRKNSHQFIPIEDFVIQDKRIDDVILSVRNSLRKFGFTAYDEQQHTGDIRHIMVRRAVKTGDVQVVLVTRTKKPIVQVFVDTLIQSNPDIKSVVQNINMHKTNVILGDTQRVLYGEDKIYDTLLGVTFGISARSFYQVNPEQTEVLYQTAIDAADVSKDDVVIDAYCGIGTIGLSIANKVKHVYGMEIVPDAIVMAKENAKLNSIQNTTFETGSAEVVMSKWQQEGIQPDVIIVDPPRKGLEASFIESSVKTNPKRIVYVSCNPATMARDLVLYNELGYTPQYVQPVDMFPMTNHVECIALLIKK